MDNNIKRTAAINILVEKGIWPVNYVPLGLRMLWRIGINVPPPIFASFWWTFIWQGALASLIYSLVTWILPLLHQDKTIEGFAIRVGVFWLIVGIFAAFSNRRLRQKHNLPSWSEIK